MNNNYLINKHNNIYIKNYKDLKILLAGESARVRKGAMGFEVG